MNFLVTFLLDQEFLKNFLKQCPILEDAKGQVCFFNADISLLQSHNFAESLLKDGSMNVPILFEIPFPALIITEICIPFEMRVLFHKIELSHVTGDGTDWILGTCNFMTV